MGQPVRSFMTYGNETCHEQLFGPSETVKLQNLRNEVYWSVSNQGGVKLYQGWNRKTSCFIWCSTTIQFSFCKKAFREQTVRQDMNPEVVLNPRS